jgi:membrane protein
VDTIRRLTGRRGAPTAADGPARPRDLGGRLWWDALKRTVTQADKDHLTDWAAALTYYSVLSLFPGLLVLVSALRLAGPSLTDQILDGVSTMTPGPAHDILRGSLGELRAGSQAAAGLLAIVGLAGALWSASGYLGAFMRAANVVFDVPEGRPLWKRLPIRLAMTVFAGVVVAAAAFTVVFTGTLAVKLGHLIHVGSGVVTVWDVAKWPVLAFVVNLMFATLYWAAPNARLGGFRWISPGSTLAVLIWVLASVGFALYIANFANYNKTYGSVAAVIIFFVWLWISNLAFLLGAEFDAELQRSRAIAAGATVHDEPYVPLRDTPGGDREEGSTIADGG